MVDGTGAPDPAGIADGVIGAGVSLGDSAVVGITGAVATAEGFEGFDAGGEVTVLAGVACDLERGTGGLAADVVNTGATAEAAGRLAGVADGTDEGGAGLDAPAVGGGITASAGAIAAGRLEGFDAGAEITALAGVTGGLERGTGGLAGVVKTGAAADAAGGLAGFEAGIGVIPPVGPVDGDDDAVGGIGAPDRAGIADGALGAGAGLDTPAVVAGVTAGDGAIAEGLGGFDAGGEIAALAGVTCGLESGTDGFAAGAVEAGAVVAGVSAAK